MDVPVGGTWEVPLESHQLTHVKPGRGVADSPSLCLLARGDILESAILGQERNPVLGRQQRASLGSMLFLPGSKVSQFSS